MEITQLAQVSLSLIAPFLPALFAISTNIGEAMAEEFAGKMGEDSWELAKKLWQKISSSEHAEQTKQSAKVVADNPGRQAYQDILQEDLLVQLEKDIELVNVLQKLLNKNQETVQKISLYESTAKNINQLSSQAAKQIVSVTRSRLENLNQEQ